MSVFIPPSIPAPMPFSTPLGKDDPASQSATEPQPHHGHKGHKGGHAPHAGGARHGQGMQRQLLAQVKSFTREASAPEKTMNAKQDQLGLDPNGRGASQAGDATDSLHAAIRNRDRRLFEQLLNGGANPNEPDARGVTPLDIALDMFERVQTRNESSESARLSAFFVMTLIASGAVVTVINQMRVSSVKALA
jgi:hypothetical protein